METIKLNGVTSIKGEINSMLTLMRIHTKWTNSYYSSDVILAKSKSQSSNDNISYEEISLVASFRLLNEYLEGLYNLEEVDCVAYISPFHDVITSDQASGPLTCAALGSLVKFTSYGFLSPNFPRAIEAVALIANCISSCVFEETDWESDEVILMKLLELSTLLFRCDASQLLTVGLAWDIYSTCISIYSQYRTSKILKSEAETALRHITLTAFSKAHLILEPSNLESEDNYKLGDDFGCSQVMKEKSWEFASSKYYFDGPIGITLLLGKIMTVLSNFMDSVVDTKPGLSFSLKLVNVALEAGGSSLSAVKVLVDILRGDICRHLLKASQSDDLSIYSLALRVVFNLFMSIKDHVKVQLEVFLISVHLRLLSQGSQSSVIPAKEELTLESLLEFCREPSLMQDIYTNYDCDVQCTNLFDSIITTLCSRAIPKGLTLSTLNSHYAEDEDLTINCDSDSLILQKANIIGSNSINKLALDGLLSILHAVSTRCVLYSEELRSRTSPMHNQSRNFVNNIPTNSSSIPESNAINDLSSSKSLTTENDASSSVFSTPIKSPPVSKSVDVIDSTKESLKLESLKCESSASSDYEEESINGRDTFDDDDPEFLMLARVRTAEILRQRKLKKQRLRIAAEKFNSHPLKTEWIRYALELNLVSYAKQHLIHNNSGVKSSNTSNLGMSSSKYDKNDFLNTIDPSSVAKFLRNTPGLGKTQIGELISKGPPDIYPFHAALLKEYVGTFDFHGKYASFSNALRLFLGHFRLPGEAQCIDRIMEAFAHRLFQSLGIGKPFKSADCVFIISFSTIMLNTDLHNSQIPLNKKMTKEQFIRNNRGINDGEDLPREFLETLYDEIKARQIQVDADIGDSSGTALLHDFTDITTWNKLINMKASQHAPAAFTPTVAARNEAVKRVTNSRKFNSAVISTGVINSTSVRENQFGQESVSVTNVSHIYVPAIHEKDMFLVMANPVLETLLLVWSYSDDNTVMKKLMEGLCDFISICVSLELKSMLNSITKLLSLKTKSLIIVNRIDIPRARSIDVSNNNPNTSKKFISKSNSQLSWDDYYDTASMIADEKRNLPKDVDVKFNKSNLEKLLTSRVDVLISPSQNILASHIFRNPDSCDQSKTLSWDGTVEVRGELMFKVLFHIIEYHHDILKYDCWLSIIDLLLFSRSRGLLPPPLVSINDSFQSISDIVGNDLGQLNSNDVHLPLTIFGRRCLLNSYEGVAISNPLDLFDGHALPYLDSSRKDVNIGQNLEASTPSLWSSMASIIWSSTPEEKQSKSIKELNNRNQNTQIITSLRGLLEYLQAKEHIPGMLEACQYDLFDGNASPYTQNSNLFNALCEGSDIDRDVNEILHLGDKFSNDDLLRLVLWTSHIDQIIFMPFKDDVVVKAIFDALLSILSEIIDNILACKSIFEESGDNDDDIANQSGKSKVVSHSSNDVDVSIDAKIVTRFHGSLEMNAVLLLEWIHSIILSNSQCFHLFWPLVHKNVFLLIFLTERDQAFLLCPYLQERCVHNIFRVAKELLPTFTTNNDYSNILWLSIKLLQTMSLPQIEILGGHVATGILSLLRSKNYTFNCDNIILIKTCDHWNIIMQLLSMATVNITGRTLVWDLLNYFINENHVNKWNFFSIHRIMSRYFLGIFPNYNDPISMLAIANQYDKIELERAMNIEYAYPWLSIAMIHMLRLLCIAIGDSYSKETKDKDNEYEYEPLHEDKDYLYFPLITWPNVKVSNNIKLSLLSNTNTISKFTITIDKDNLDVVKDVKDVIDVYDSKYDLIENTSFRPTHIRVKKQSIVIHRSYVEDLYLDLCSNYAIILHSHNVIPIVETSRLICCLQALLKAGEIAHFNSNLWYNVLDHLINRLPITISDMCLKIKTLNNKKYNTGNTLLENQSFEVSLQCCNIVFALIIKHIKCIQDSQDFQTLWLLFLEILAINISDTNQIANIMNSNSNIQTSQSSKGVTGSINPLVVIDTYCDEILEMIIALLRILRPIKPSSYQNSSQQSIQPNTNSSNSSQQGLFGFVYSLFGSSNKRDEELNQSLDYIQTSATLISSPNTTDNLINKSIDLSDLTNIKQDELLIASWHKVSSIQQLLKSRNPILVSDITRVVEQSRLRKVSMTSLSPIKSDGQHGNDKVNAISNVKVPSPSSSVLVVTPLKSDNSLISKKSPKANHFIDPNIIQVV